MSLHEQIKFHRTQCGLSQEQLAERIGVTRQAVTKWETGRSAPSTENLLHLAEIFGVGMNELTDTVPPIPPDPRDALIAALRAEEERKIRERRECRQRNLLTVAAVLLGYIAWYLVCRILFLPTENSTILSWLLSTEPRRLPYLYGWLCHGYRYGSTFLISIAFALFGRRITALLSLAGFLLGYILGECFGYYPAGNAIGQNHYGWLIWGVVFLLFLLGGCIWEHIRRKNGL